MHVLVPTWVFVLCLGFECDNFFFFFFLDVTLKSILCQSETLVLNQLLCIALTVRQFAGKWMNLSALFTHFNEGSCFFLFFILSCHFEGFKAYPCNYSSFSSWWDWATVAVIDTCTTKWGSFKISHKRGEEYLQSFTVCILRACEALWSHKLVRWWTDDPGALYASISRPDTCGYSSIVCYVC